MVCQTFCPVTYMYVKLCFIVCYQVWKKWNKSWWKFKMVFPYLFCILNTCLPKYLHSNIPKESMDYLGNRGSHAWNIHRDFRKSNEIGADSYSLQMKEGVSDSFWCCIAAENWSPGSSTAISKILIQGAAHSNAAKASPSTRAAETPVLPCTLQSPPERRRPGRTWTWPFCDYEFPADTPPSYPRYCTPITTKRHNKPLLPWIEPNVSVLSLLPTLRMLSLGLLIFSWRERVRDDLRWCLRTFPSPRPLWVPS